MIPASAFRSEVVSSAMGIVVDKNLDDTVSMFLLYDLVRGSLRGTIRCCFPISFSSSK